MAEATFLVKVNVDDVSALPQYAMEIQDDLHVAGHDVISVAPWARPSLQLPTGTASGFAPLAFPPNTLGIPPNA